MRYITNFKLKLIETNHTCRDGRQAFPAIFLLIKRSRLKLMGVNKSTPFKLDNRNPNFIFRYQQLLSAIIKNSLFFVSL